MIGLAQTLHDQLLAHADHVLRSVIGHESQADLRRAVSTAYYSVFHLICTDAANRFAGAIQNRRNAPFYDLKAYAHVYRSLDHKHLRRVCDIIRAKSLDRSISEMLPTGKCTPELARFASITVELYEARLRADYDPIVRFEAADANAKVESAREAFSLYRRFQLAKPANDRAVFLTLLMFNRRP